MDDPINWGRAEIYWAGSSGYTLRLPLHAEARALSLREDELANAVRAAFPGRSEIEMTFVPMVREEGPTGASAEVGEIAIGTETMITPGEARQLREGITQALSGVLAEADRVKAEDAASAQALLEILRAPTP